MTQNKKDRKLGNALRAAYPHVRMVLGRIHDTGTKSARGFLPRVQRAFKRARGY